MPVLNIPANQVLAEPITNYYKGKAVRAEIADKEAVTELRKTQTEALKQEIADAPAAAKAAQEKAALDKQKAILDIQKGIEDLGYTRMKRRADALGPVVKDAEEMFKAGDHEGAANYMTEAIPAALQDVDPEAAAQIMEMRGSDQVWQPEEMMRLKNRVEGFYEFEEDGGQYTLSPGQGRYDAEGNLIVSAPKDKSGEGYAPTPLQKEIEPLVERGVLTREEADRIYLDKNKPSSETGGIRDQKISDVSRMLGGDDDTAIKIVDGLIEMKQNPATGMVELYDKVTRKAWEIPIENKTRVVVSPEPGKTLWDLAKYATGPSSAATAAWNIPAAWIGLPVNHKVTEARQSFRTTSQNFVRALSINPRFPVGEQNRIREEISVLPAILDAPELMMTRMQSLKSDLTLRMNQAEADGNDTALPKDTRESQKSNANEIRNFLAIMGVPDAASQEPVPDYVPNEARDLWNYMSPDEQKEYMNAN